MKKRLRKKRHKGEFAQYGISFFVEANENNVQEKLDIITEIADKNNVLFIGGGFGYFTMPSEKYGNMNIPKKIEDLIFFVALSDSPHHEGIIGYFTNPAQREIDVEIAKKVKTDLEKALQITLQIKLRIDLWNVMNEG
jgi:hypothetical protein